MKIKNECCFETETESEKWISYSMKMNLIKDKQILQNERKMSRLGNREQIEAARNTRTTIVRQESQRSRRK